MILSAAMAVFHWMLVLLYLIVGDAFIALLWVVPASIWSTLAYLQIRDTLGE
jgi:hypothetical protein